MDAHRIGRRISDRRARWWIRTIQIEFSPRCWGIRTERTKRAAYFDRPMAARHGRKFCTKMKTRARSLWSSTHRIRKLFTRICGARGGRHGRLGIRSRVHQRTFQIHRRRKYLEGIDGRVCRRSRKGAEELASELRQPIRIGFTRGWMPTRRTAEFTAPMMAARLAAGERERRIWGRGVDFACVRVDPRDKDTIYVANTSLYRSTDGGKNFHCDQRRARRRRLPHDLDQSGKSRTSFCSASDQGATISPNRGETWSSWYNQPTAQFYHVSTDTQFPYWVYGGQQESARRRRQPQRLWRNYFSRLASGGRRRIRIRGAPIQLNPNIFTAEKCGRCFRITGASQDVSPRAPQGVRYRYNRTAPLVWVPVDKHALYFASQFLFKTIDGGRSWQTISPDLTREESGVPANIGSLRAKLPKREAEHRGVIYTMAPSYRDANLTWVGTDDGQIGRDARRRKNVVRTLRRPN